MVVDAALLCREENIPFEDSWDFYRNMSTIEDIAWKNTEKFSSTIKCPLMIYPILDRWALDTPKQYDDMFLLLTS